MTVVAFLDRQPTAIQRGVAGLLAILVLGAAVFGLVPGVRALIASQDHWRREVQLKLERARSEVAYDVPLRKQLQTLPSAAVWQRLYIDAPGVNPETLLRQDVTAMARSAGITIQTLVALPTAEESLIQQHAVRITAAMPIDQLTRLLTALRSNPRYVRISRLTVAAPQKQNANENPALQVQLDVLGYSPGIGNGPTP